MKGEILTTLAWIIFAGIGAQWLAWRLRLPSILLLLLTGFLVGPLSAHILPGTRRAIDPDSVFGELLFPIVSLCVGVILFEGGLSLRLREIAETRAVVFRLVTVGVGVTWVLTTFAALWLLDLDLSLSLLFGAILTVTGPTVIGPLLRHIRPSGRVGSIVQWEGIVNDGIGALLSVLVFEVVLSGLERTPSVFVGGIAKTILLGIGGGAATGWIFVLLLRRYWIPDSLHSPAALASALLLFGVSNQIQHESGLAAVTVFGIYLANQNRVSIKHIIEFKENLRVLLIAVLFILLSARLELSDLAHVNSGSLLFLAALIVVIRPAAVLCSTFRSPLNFRERIFISWMAPRGIVAASVASVFALRLGGTEGFEDAERLAPLMFITIIGTVAIYGLTAGPLARALKLSFPNPQGVLFVGAHRWARDMALALHQQGFRVLMVDTNWANISASRMAGLPTFYGSALSGYATEEIPLSGVGRLIALTQNDEVNSLATLHFAEAFGRQEVYQISVVTADGPRQDTTVARGRRVFGQDVTFGRMEANFQKGWRVRTIALTETLGYDEIRARLEGEILPLFAVSSDGRQLTVFAADKDPKPRPGQTLIAFVPKEVDASVLPEAPATVGKEMETEGE